MIKIYSKTILLSELLLVLLNTTTAFGMKLECYIPQDSLYAYVPEEGKRRAILPSGHLSNNSMSYTNGGGVQINNNQPFYPKNDFMGEIIKKNEQNNTFYYIKVTREYSPAFVKDPDRPLVRINMTDNQFSKLNTLMNNPIKGPTVAIDNQNNTYTIPNLLTTSTMEENPKIELKQPFSQKISPEIEKLKQEEKEIDEIMKEDETDEQEITKFSAKSTNKKNQPAPYWTKNKKIALAAVGMSLFLALVYYIQKHNITISDLFAHS